MDNHTERQVAWTLSDKLIFQLSILLDKATKHYLNGNYEQAFFHMKALRHRVVQSFNSKEREEVKAKENQIKTKITNINRGNNNHSAWDTPEDYQTKKSSLIEDYEDYNDLLMDLLEKYNYTINKKKDDTKINQ